MHFKASKDDLLFFGGGGEGGGVELVPYFDISPHAQQLASHIFTQSSRLFDLSGLTGTNSVRCRVFECF